MQEQRALLALLRNNEERASPTDWFAALGINGQKDNFQSNAAAEHNVISAKLGQSCSNIRPVSLFQPAGPKKSPSAMSGYNEECNLEGRRE